jgi:hypothetical protein
VQVRRVDELGELRGEAYTELAREFGARTDVRGSIADGGGVLRVKVALAPALIDAGVGSYYVGLDQPLAHLVVAALEPDTQSSFVTNRIVDNVSAIARVLRPPELKTTAMP